MPLLGIVEGSLTCLRGFKCLSLAILRELLMHVLSERCDLCVNRYAVRQLVPKCRFISLQHLVLMVGLLHLILYVYWMHIFCMPAYLPKDEGRNEMSCSDKACLWYERDLTSISLWSVILAAKSRSYKTSNFTFALPTERELDTMTLQTFVCAYSTFSLKEGLSKLIMKESILITWAKITSACRDGYWLSK